MNHSAPAASAAIPVVAWIAIADLLLFGLLMYYVETPRLVDECEQAVKAAETLEAKVARAEADAAACRKERDEAAARADEAEKKHRLALAELVQARDAASRAKRLKERLDEV